MSGRNKEKIYAEFSLIFKALILHLETRREEEENKEKISCAKLWKYILHVEYMLLSFDEQGQK